MTKIYTILNISLVDSQVSCYSISIMYIILYNVFSNYVQYQYNNIKYMKCTRYHAFFFLDYVQI